MNIGWDEVADDYKDITVPFLAQYLPKLIELADLGPDLNVLDVGTGTGLAAVEAAKRILPEGRVLATDFSVRMLSHARALIDDNQLTNIDIYAMTAEDLDIHSETFDRVICNFSLPFFQDRKKALDEMFRVLKPEGKAAISIWADRENCLVLGIMDAIVQETVSDLENLIKPSLFDLGTDDAISTALDDTGFSSFEIHHETHTARYKKAEDYWEKLYRTGPDLRETLSEFSEEQVAHIRKRVLTEVEKHRQGDKIILPSEALIAIAIK